MKKSKDLEQLDHQFIEDRKREERTKSEEYKARAKQARELALTQDAESAALQHTISYTDKKGNKITHWQVVLEKANGFLSTSDVTSFNDYRNAIMKIVDICGDFNKAMYGTMITSGAVNSIKWAFGELPVRVKDHFTGDPKVDLPPLAHNVDIIDNKLVIDPLIRRDNQEGSGLDMYFQGAVVAWLQEQGYTPDPSPDPKHKGQFVDDHGVILDKARFDALNTGNTGLAKYLEEGSQLSFTDASTPRPGR